MTHIIIYDRATPIGVLSGEPRDAWITARATINTLARDAGPGRMESSHREWYRSTGRISYQRCGFRAVNVVRP